MKMFNTENGVKKVYVQLNDIMILRKINKDMPASIEVFTNIIIVDNIIDDSNIMNFVEFKQPREIEFFESIDWIIDYKQVRNLSEEEINAMRQNISLEINDIMNKINAISDNEEESQSLMLRYYLLDYKLKNLDEIICNRKGNKQIPFPLVPDSDGFSFDSDDDFKYEIRASLDPNKLLLFRKDGKKLSNLDRIPQDFLSMGISLALIHRSEHDNYFGTYEVKHFLTENSQYIVTEFKVQIHDNNIEKGKDAKEDVKGIKKLTKKIFKKKQK